MDECYIVQSINDYEYKVHKFDGTSYLPETTYIVTFRKNKVACSCPSGTYRGYCKHITMVSKYRAIEKLTDDIPIMMFEA